MKKDIEGCYATLESFKRTACFPLNDFEVNDKEFIKSIEDKNKW
jgi:hypothetical protein